jgi:hypothetical protein
MPHFDRHARYFARSAEADMVLPPVAGTTKLSGASPAIACLCRAYSSSRSRFYPSKPRKPERQMSIQSAALRSRSNFLYMNRSLYTYRWIAARLPCLHVGGLLPEQDVHVVIYTVHHFSIGRLLAQVPMLTNHNYISLVAMELSGACVCLVSFSIVVSFLVDALERDRRHHQLVVVSSFLTWRPNRNRVFT